MESRPIEFNPVVLRTYADKLGVAKPVNFYDVIDLEKDPTDSLLIDIKAVFLLCEKENIRCCDNVKEMKDNTIFMIEQPSTEVSGIVAIMHALINKDIPLKPDSYLTKFRDESKALNPKKRGELLQNDDKLKAIRKELVDVEESKISHEDSVNRHSVCFIEYKGNLIELDGRKPYPLDHGECHKLVTDAQTVAKKCLLTGKASMIVLSL